MSWEYELVAGSLGSPTDGPVWNGELTDFRRWTNHTTSRYLIPHWEEALPQEARSTLAKDGTIPESD